MNHRRQHSNAGLARPTLPFGATWDGEGGHFALFSENAMGVELCHFDQAIGDKETALIQLRQRTHGVWS